MRQAAAVLLVALSVPGLSGCLDVLDGLDRPDYRVSRTQLATGPGAWNRDPTFAVQVQQAEPVHVVIEARPAGGGIPRSAEGLSSATRQVELDLPDGTWTIEYTVGGHEWETFRDVRFDSTPPSIEGLETLGSAPDGRYTLGAGATVEPGATVRVVDQDTGAALAERIPVQVGPLGDGVHAFDVVAADEAGNEAVWTVQVVAGSATQLPPGRFTAGIVARYTTELELWDLTDLDAYLSPAAARAAAPDHLGSGQGITPGDPAVRQVVDAVVLPGMSTAEAALALYTWMFGNLEYDEARLEESDLLDPAETLQAGGGVCRDLAGLYVSLLRAAGIPARLVAGYLAGRVNGFHAWVEFYGGRGPSPWVPVDVSGIDGDYEASGMLQAFAVRLPEHLMLRPVTPEQEQGDWSSAASLSYTSPSTAPSPEAPFRRQLEDVIPPTEQALCIDEETLFRSVASDPKFCTTPRRAHIPGFVTRAQRVLDYGIEVVSAPRGTTLRLALTYPAQGVGEAVDFVYYSPDPSDGLQSSGFREDPAAGRASAELRR